MPTRADLDRDQAIIEISKQLRLANEIQLFEMVWDRLSTEEANRRYVELLERVRGART